MTDQIYETGYALELLRKSFPGRSDRQLMPFGMVYCGTRWGRDFRCHEVPMINTQYFNEVKTLASPEVLAELDEKEQRQRYTLVEEEMMEWLELAPTVGHIDVPWRIPLAVVIKKEQGREQQTELLNIFYSAFFRHLEEEKK